MLDIANVIEEQEAREGNCSSKEVFINQFADMTEMMNAQQLILLTPKLMALKLVTLITPILMI